MNKRRLLNIIIALSVFGFSPIPVLAQVQLPETSVPNQNTTIPQSSAITITFPVEVSLNAEQKSRLPTSALLAQPLLDSSGNVVAAANSPVTIQLQPTKGGVQIQAEALVIGGRVTPILASGSLIPYHTVTNISGTQQAQAHQGFFNSLAGSVAGVLGATIWPSNAQGTNLTNLGSILGAGLSIVSGLSSPKTTRQADIPQGSVYVLTLQAPLSLAPRTIQTSLPTQTSTIPTPIAGTTMIKGSITPALSVQAPASVTVIYVNPGTGIDRADAGNTKAAPYKTITYALNQAQAGTIIQLATGNYTSETGEVFPLVLKEGVTLRGDESTKGQNTVISGGGHYHTQTFRDQNITVEAENDSTITGVTITNLNTRGTAVWIEFTNPTVKNSTFANNNREGIFVTGTSAPKIEANVFTMNKGNGISVVRSAQGEIRSNRFEDTGFALAIGDSSSPLVVDNQIIQNTDGLVISEDAHPVLRHNIIKSNKRDGIVAIHNARPDLGTKESAGHNTISSNGRYDINNATGSNTLVAVGDDIDAEHISGKVDQGATIATQSCVKDDCGREQVQHPPSDSQTQLEHQSGVDTDKKSTEGI